MQDKNLNDRQPAAGEESEATIASTHSPVGFTDEHSDEEAFGGAAHTVNESSDNSVVSSMSDSAEERSIREDNPSPLSDTSSEDALSDANGISDAHEEDNADESDRKPENEDKGGISSDLIRGHINTIILRALYDMDKYGYEIMNDIEAKSHGQYTLKQPTLYSALKRLETQGYIRAYWKNDEISSGGRRKYFTLTESGREITEKNLAEWEYSRTIIDSLISDRSFDFSQPAPTPVDFTILRNSVSRVPVVHTDEATTTEAAEGSSSSTETENATTTSHPTQSEETLNPQSDQNGASETTTAPPSEQSPQTPPVSQNPDESQPDRQATIVEGQTQSAVTSQNSPAPQPDPDQEARRIAHENYLRLISQPVSRPEPAEDVVPNSSNVDANDLLYINKPETERDYKNLINGIYNRAVTNGSVQTGYVRSNVGASSRNVYGAQPSQVVDRGRADGIRVSPSDEYETHANYATKTTYNKGLTLFKSSAVVLFVLLIEFVFTLIFRENLGVGILYPVVLLCLGLVQFAIFGLLALKGYGANCARPTNSAYLSKSIIITIIAILIICVLALLMNVTFTLVSEVMKMIVIPAITALNIIIFAVSFKILMK